MASSLSPISSNSFAALVAARLERARQERPPAPKPTGDGWSPQGSATTQTLTGEPGRSPTARLTEVISRDAPRELQALLGSFAPGTQIPCGDALRPIRSKSDHPALQAESLPPAAAALVFAARAGKPRCFAELSGGCELDRGALTLGLLVAAHEGRISGHEVYRMLASPGSPLQADDVRAALRLSAQGDDPGRILSTLLQHPAVLPEHAAEAQRLARGTPADPIVREMRAEAFDACGKLA